MPSVPRSSITRRTRNTRHTTHIQALPPRVRIVREKHPLEGRTLDVLGHMYRRSGLQLILCLPEGGTASVPATWTDLEGAAAEGLNKQPRCRSLGSAADLLRACTVVDALLRPLLSEHRCPGAKEGSDATGASALAPTAAPEAIALGASESRASDEADRGDRPPDAEGRPWRAEEGHR